jgi:ABC-type multidrug transport system fused ATPase/permease subunit
VRSEAAQAVRDIRDAHRRGPKPNTRPLPAWVRRLAWVLDDAVPVPGTAGRRVGVDGFLTLVPGIGDAAGLVLSMVVVFAGVAAGVSLPTLLRMLVNVGFESLVGLIPFAGALFDMVYKANDRNVRLIERDLADRRGTSRSSLAVLALLLLTLFLGFVMLIAVTVAGIAVVVWFVGKVL